MNINENKFDFFRYIVCVICAIAADIATMLGLFICVIIGAGINVLGLHYWFYAIPILMYVFYILIRGYGHYLLSIGGVDDRFAARKKHPVITYGINK